MVKVTLKLKFKISKAQPLEGGSFINLEKVWFKKQICKKIIVSAVFLLDYPDLFSTQQVA